MNKTARSFDFCAGDRKKKKTQTSESTAENDKCSQHSGSGEVAGSDPRGSTPHGELAVLSEEGVCGQNTGTLGKARLAEMGEAHSRQREPQGREPCGGQLGESKDGEEGTQSWRSRKGPDRPGTRKTRKGSAFYSEIRCRRQTQPDTFLNGAVGSEAQRMEWGQGKERNST